MNKIIIDKEEVLDFKDNVLYLDIQVNKLTINISGRVLINEFINKTNDNLELTININNNSELLYNRLLETNIMNSKITINQDSNSSLEFNNSIIAKDKGNLDISCNVTGNNNITNIKVRAITKDKGSLVLKCTTDNKDNTDNNELLESLKILMLNNEESIIIPDLLVASNEVEVNHAATISGINKDELFYLTSKGISIKDASKLISEGFIINNLNISNKDKKEIRGGNKCLEKIFQC